MKPIVGSTPPKPGEPCIGIYSPYATSFVLLDNTRIVMDQDQVYPDNNSSEYRAVVISAGNTLSDLLVYMPGKKQRVIIVRIMSSVWQKISLVKRLSGLKNL